MSYREVLLPCPANTMDLLQLIICCGSVSIPDPDLSSVTLSCKYNGSLTTDDLLWYRQYSRSKPEFLILVNEANSEIKADPPVDGVSAKVNEEKNGVDLKISSTAVSDSALYYCALRPTSTVTGNRPNTVLKPVFVKYVEQLIFQEGALFLICWFTFSFFSIQVITSVCFGTSIIIMVIYWGNDYLVWWVKVLNCAAIVYKLLHANCRDISFIVTCLSTPESVCLHTVYRYHPL
uniref:Ig-like domain-containing protein n=1 Tax=Astyanax mexicanus TaxID=7994 RepID=A0A3B1K8F8_ASTMX